MFMYIVYVYVYCILYMYTSINFLEDGHMVEASWKIDYLLTIYTVLFQYIFLFIYYIK